MYDVSCEKLARSFLRDVNRDEDEQMVKELAQEIQDTIEQYFEDMELQP